MTDMKLQKLFMINSIDTENSAFENASISDVVFVVSKQLYKVFIDVDNYVEPELLKEVEEKFRTNQKVPVKLYFNVRNSKNRDINIILKYLDYIRHYKAEIKQGIISKLDQQDFRLENNILHVIIRTNSQYNLIKEHMEYYYKHLQRYGFRDLILDYQLLIEENDILTINQNEIKKYQLPKEQIQVNDNSVNNNSNSKKSSYNRSKVDMNTPSFAQISDLDYDAPGIVLHGKVFAKEKKVLNTGTILNSIAITDYSDSISCRFFSKTANRDNIDELEIGDWIAVLGDVRYDSYSNEQVLIGKSIQKIENKYVREDNSERKRVELHVHTKMSTMDGVVDVKSLLKLVNQWNHKAIAITDHLNVQAFPDVYNESLKYPNLKIIYGMEADVVDDKVHYVKNAKHVDLRSSKYVIFDLETTGLSNEYDEIIEFGAVIMDGVNGERKTINYLFKPSEPISAFTTDLTGITNEMLEDKPRFIDKVDDILEIFKDAILVAHNSEFDMGFIQSWIKKTNRQPINNTVIDTLQLARAMEKGLKNYRLGTIARRYEVFYNEEVAHRADYDATVLADIYEHQLRKMLDEYSIIYDDEIEKIHNTEIYHKLRPMHMTMLAKNQKGLFDLFKLTSLSHTQYFYSTPRMLRNIVNQYRENLLIGSSCVNNDIFEIARNRSQEELAEALKFYDYIEIQPPSVYKNLIQTGDLTEERLQTILKNIIMTAKQNNKIVVVSGDVHYLNPEDKILREIYIHSKGIGGRRHPLFDYRNRVHDYPDQYLRTTEEMLNEMKFIGNEELIKEIVIDNTNYIADQIEKVEVIKDKLYTPRIEGSDDLLKELCYQNGHKIYGNPLPSQVSTRLEQELNAIIKHGFGVIYWIAHKLVKKSLDDGYLVGSRGSVGSSLVATLSEITEVNPLQPHYVCPNCCFSEFITDGSFKCGFDLPAKNCPKCNSQLKGDGHDIPFETFLGFEADKVPDIDLNFSGEYQSIAHDFTKEMFGEKSVYRAGTISTVAEKTAFGYVKGYFEEKNVLHLKRKIDIERIAKGCEGVKRTTGQHPGGIVVIPSEYDVEEFTPVNYPADDYTSTWLTTHFDFHAIHDNVLKLDILGHVDPTALKMLHDLTGVDPKTIPVNDQEVLSLFNGLESLKIKPEDINNEKTGAMGIPEFGTTFVRKMLLDTKPKSFADLVQISGLSHGTNVWIGNAQELIKNNPDITISNVIGCRDDIMVNLIYKGLDANMAFKIMEDVRKGKGLKDEYVKLMKENNVEQWYIDSCNKIKYMFPKAHATAYVLMAWRIAWYKINYPAEYYATYFTTRTSVFDIKTILKGKAAIEATLNDILKRLDNKNTPSANKPSQKEKDLVPVYEVVLEMLARGIKMSNVSLEESENVRYIIKVNENNEKVIIPPFSAIDGLGEAVGESIIRARNEKKFVSISDFQKRTIVTKAHLESFIDLNIFQDLSDDDQIKFDF